MIDAVTRAGPGHTARWRVAVASVRALARNSAAMAIASMVPLAATAQSPQGSARSRDANPDVAGLETVVVEAERLRALEREISGFVTGITLPSRTESLARWERSICAYAAGFPLEQTTFVTQRVAQIASEAGAPVAPQGCSPNLLVVITAEPKLLLRQWWGKNPRLFDTRRGVGTIKRTIATDVPVRVFYNVCSAAPAKQFGLSVILDCDKGAVGSKLSWGSIRAIYSVIVVVDLQQTQGLAIGQLTDHVAMLALAQIRRDPELGNAPTILRLFDPTSASRPQELSTWDLAFLASLYGTDAGSVMQSSEIKVRMKRDLVR